jgi:hypothetical protein
MRAAGSYIKRGVQTRVSNAFDAVKGFFGGGRK